MLDEYAVKGLIDSLGMNAVNLNELMKYSLLNQVYLNVNNEQKERITESFVQGLCIQLKNGGKISEETILKHLLNTDLIHDSLLNLSDEIKGLIEFKLEKIFSEMGVKSIYDDLFITLKNEVTPFLKKSVQEILSGESKTILNSTLKNITMAFTQTSIKDHAEKLFKKAQGIINEEIIKEIIE